MPRATPMTVFALGMNGCAQKLGLYVLVNELHFPLPLASNLQISKPQGDFLDEGGARQTGTYTAVVADGGLVQNLS